MKIKAPFPYFGGKSRIASLVWGALGDVTNYIEPFAGSAAVLLARPSDHKGGVETINDANGYVANFWRATAKAPEEIARWADWPVNEADLHARHLWLLGQHDGLVSRLMADPDWFDAKIAGWWAWGASAWIGSGWCSGKGPWSAEGGRFVKRKGAGPGVHRQLPHLGGWQGVHRRSSESLIAYFGLLHERLRRVRVACGDWARVTGRSVRRLGAGPTGFFLDPPYKSPNKIEYGHAANGVEEFARDAAEEGHRVVLCGYSGEYDLPGWREVWWKARGGYGSQGRGRGRENANKETLWLSPACL